MFTKIAVTRMAPACVLLASVVVGTSCASAKSVGDRDLAIATVLYAKAAGSACPGFAVNETALQAFLRDNALAASDVDPAGRRAREIREAQAKLGRTFATNGDDACRVADLLLGQKGYMSPHLLVRKPSTEALYVEPATRR